MNMAEYRMEPRDIQGDYWAGEQRKMSVLSVAIPVKGELNSDQITEQL